MKIALVLVMACSNASNTPSTRIDEPRVIGIAVDPPVIAPGTIATVRALVVDTDGAAVAGAPAMRACRPGLTVRDPDVDCGPADSLALAPTGDGGATLDAAALLARFPVTGTPPPPDDPCPLAYPYLEVAVIAEADVGDVHLIARKQVRLAPSPVFRRNPVLGDLLLDGVSTDQYDSGTPATLEVLPELASLDPTCTGDTPPAIVTEPVQIFLFSTGGDFADPDIRVHFDTAGNETAGTTDFTGPPGEVVLWAVGLDGDGGLGWSRYDLRAR